MRVLAGCVLLAYFVNTLRQAGDFSDPDGLIDHRLSVQLLPPTRIGLFRPGVPGRVFRAVYLSACIAAVFVIVGYYPRVSAAFLFAAAVSTYRWNVLVAYLDDSVVHIFCLWLVLLPVGNTLNLPDLVVAGTTTGGWSRAATEWLAVTVPGTAPRAFMANMALIYLVAGLYKFSSPMWRSGSAMHAALKMPIAHAPDFWTMRHCAALRVVTLAALVLEPLFVLLYLLPAHSAAKWALVAAAAVFHLGIIATLKIPYSNALMLAALAVALGPEIVQGATAGLPAATSVPTAGNAPAEAVAVTLVALLAIMFPWEAARTRWKLGRPYSSNGWANPVRSLLWVFGIFQSYRLFDWVDARNYHVRYEVRRIHGGNPHARTDRVDARELFPNSMRHLLLQSYFFGNIWLQMEPEKLDSIRRSLLVRHARRFARAHPDAGDIEAFAIVQRITPDNLELTRGEEHLLMRFRCANGEVAMRHPDSCTP